MRILTRYIFREFLVPLAYCLTGFTAIYVLFELFGSFSRIADAKLPASTTAEYLAGYLSPFFHYLAPAALMLATLYTMWNFCRHSEITAMRASGISLWTVARPVLFGAALVAAFTAWVNESYMPRRARWAKELRTARFDADKVGGDKGFTFVNSADRRSWTVQGRRNSECSKLRDVRVAMDRPGGERVATLTAEKAEYLDGEWWFTNPKIQRYGADGRPVATDTPELDALPLRAFPEFGERPEDIANQTGDARFASVAGKLRYIAMNRDLTGDARRDAVYDAWAQAVSPLACIVLTLIAIPAGIASGRQSVFNGVVGALALFFLYYALVIGCMVLAKTGLMPAIPAAVLPPAAFAVVGAFRCVRPLGATMWLAAAFFALVAAYAASAFFLRTRLGMEYAMAHSLAATLPAMAAALCVFKFDSRG